MQFVDSAHADEWTGAAIAFQNPGGVRSAITKGDITYADIVSVIPFENTYHMVELNGTAITEILEFGVLNLNKMNVMQLAGVKVVFDLNREPYKRIAELKVICQICDIPRYAPIDEKKVYKVIMPEYIAQGGDGFTMIPRYAKNAITGGRDVDILSEYIRRTSPIIVPPLRGRITFK